MPSSPLRVTLTLPWPDSRLSPNARVHWGERREATETARAVARTAARNARAANGWRMLRPPVQAHVVFVVPDRRRRDQDNLLASCKAFFDGLVGELIEDDSTDKFRLSHEVLLERGKREVRLTLTETA